MNWLGYMGLAWLSVGAGLEFERWPWFSAAIAFLGAMILSELRNKQD